MKMSLGDEAAPAGVSAAAQRQEGHQEVHPDDVEPGDTTVDLGK
jgi:hypothetical protein